MSSSASTSRSILAPLTPAHVEPSSSSSSSTSSTTSSSSSSPAYTATSYSVRMGRATPNSTSSLSRASSVSSSTSRRSSSSNYAANPVVRNGHIIPLIKLTPPDDKPRRSAGLPWQDFTSKTTLYVPQKTEAVGWEEGGLWWHGKFEYPEVSLYGGADDRIVGKYRGGPKGYGYMEVWDEDGFNHQAPTKHEEPAPQKPTVEVKPARRATEPAPEKPDQSIKREKAAAPATKIAPSRSTTVAAVSVSDKPSTVESVTTEDDSQPQMPRRQRESSSSSFISTISSSSDSSYSDSASSSRRTSDSLSGIETTCTTPRDTPLASDAVTAAIEGKMLLTEGITDSPDKMIVDSPVDETKSGLSAVSATKNPLTRLEAALWALKAEKESSPSIDGDGDSAMTDKPFEDDEDDTDTPKSKFSRQNGGGLQQLSLSKTMTLSDDGPSATHRWPRGRGKAKMTAPAVVVGASSS